MVAAINMGVVIWQKEELQSEVGFLTCGHPEL